MPEYTDEQIAQLLSDAKKGMLTQEEHQRELQREVDRRVESGIQKGLETHAEKIRREAEEKATMTAEERAKKEISEKEKTLIAREKEILKKTNELEAQNMLISANIPKEQYSKLLGVFVNEDSEVTKTNVQNFIEVFNATKTDVETKVRSEFSKLPPPSSGGNTTLSKSDFDKMSYVQKVELKTKQPELYKQFMT